MKIPFWTVCGLALATSLLPAQQGTLAGPVAGFVFDDSARALRRTLKRVCVCVCVSAVARCFELALSFFALASIAPVFCKLCSNSHHRHPVPDSERVLHIF
jgi:hypothetical protein